MSISLNVAVAGCGEVARHYGDGLVDRVPGLSLTGAFDVDDRQLDSFASRYGVRKYRDLAEMLRDGVDLLCVCTPNSTHARVALQAMEAGCHVLIEHPLAMNPRDAEMLIQQSALLGRRIFVVRQRRFLESVQLLKAALAGGILEAPVRADATIFWNRKPEYYRQRAWRQDAENGGVIINQSSHFLDLLLYLFGEPGACGGIYGRARREINVEDAFFGEIQFGRTTVHVAATTAAPEGVNTGSLSFCSGGGEIRLSGKNWEELQGLPDETRAELKARLDGALTGDHLGYFSRVASQLLGRRGAEVVDGGEAAKAVRLIDRIYSGCTRSDDDARLRIAACNFS